MCRLLGVATGGPRVDAAFWLLDAPDSLEAQSVEMPDGVGIGWFSLGDEPVRDRAPIRATDNPDFQSFARSARSHTFIAHVRYSTGTAISVHNTHPFDMRDRLFAHNGLVRGTDTLQSWLTPEQRVGIEGNTDSELVFAYLTAEIEKHGDTTAGLISGVQRIANELPVYALNVLLAEPRRLWALRYPDTHELWVLNPELGGFAGERTLHAGHEPGNVVLTGDDRRVPAYVIASERMDDDPDWRLLAPGELLVIDGLKATSLFPFGEPKHRLRHADLDAQAAAAQHPVTSD